MLGTKKNCNDKILFIDEILCIKLSCYKQTCWTSFFAVACFYSIGTVTLTNHTVTDFTISAMAALLAVYSKQALYDQIHINVNNITPYWLNFKYDAFYNKNITT